MKKIRAVLMLLTLVFITLPVHAQLNKANKLFRYYCYAEAIPLYRKAAEKEKNPLLRANAVTRLADCYRFTNNTELAVEWYAKVIQLDKIAPENYFFYGQALQSRGLYEKAKAAFLKYSQVVPGDSRGDAFASYCDLPEQWDSIPAEFDIQPMNALNSKWSDFGPSYYKNGLIFTSDRRKNFLENKTYGWTNNNFLDLYFVKQDIAEGPISEMHSVKSFSKNLNQAYHDGPVTFSRDYSVIYLTRSYNDRTVEKDHLKNHLLKIFYAKAYGKNWSDEIPFSLNSENYSVAHPSLSVDGKTIYFSSDMPGGCGASDIWCCDWGNGRWGVPVNLGKEVNTSGNEVFPFMMNDSVMYYSSSGLPGYGGLDVFVTKKKNGSWQKPRNLRKPVNSSYDDFSLILNAGESQGYFSSNRPGGLGSDDIYAIKRLRIIPDAKPAEMPKSMPLFVSGFVKDKNSMLPVAGANVYLLNTLKDSVKVLCTNAEGFYESVADRNTGYFAKAIKLNYLPDCLNFEPVSGDTTTRLNASKDLLLEKSELNKVFNLENIYYDFNKWNIRSDAKPELDKLVQLMLENPISIELESHTDARGSAQYNMKLSQKRAESVVHYIVQQGIAAGRISAKGYGESKLTNRCADGERCTPAEHQANRRTSFVVTGSKTQGANSSAEIKKFSAGDEIPANQFGKDFFINCVPAKVINAGTGKDTLQETKVDPKPVTGATLPEKSVIIYKVQLFSLTKRRPLAATAFIKLRDVQYYTENERYKYTSGLYNNVGSLPASLGALRSKCGLIF